MLKVKYSDYTTDMLSNKTPVFIVRAYKYTIVFTFFAGT